MTATRPGASEYAPYYERYIATVPAGSIVDILLAQKALLAHYPRRVPAERETFRYADGKWTIREVFGHLTDVERVFGYRLLRVSRGDSTPLPGFDENRYVEASGSNNRPLRAHVDELVLVRESNLMVMRALDADAWQRTGVANNSPVSVRAIACILAGHVNHHLSILRDRYGV